MVRDAYGGLDTLNHRVFVWNFSGYHLMVPPQLIDRWGYLYQDRDMESGSSKVRITEERFRILKFDSGQFYSQSGGNADAGSLIREKWDFGLSASSLDGYIGFHDELEICGGIRPMVDSVRMGTGRIVYRIDVAWPCSIEEKRTLTYFEFGVGLIYQSTSVVAGKKASTRSVVLFEKGGSPYDPMPLIRMVDERLTH